MPHAVRVTIHPSQWPAQVLATLRSDLAVRRLDPKYHYLSHRQVQAWLALHERYSPFFTTLDGTDLYDSASRHVAESMSQVPIHVISLGCGGGQKDALLLRRRKDLPTRYSPVDVGLGMVLTAHQRAASIIGSQQSSPVVLDLVQVADLERTVCLGEAPSDRRVILFFGMLPNVDPALAGERLRSLLRPDDLLVLSANLAPGADYPGGTRGVLPLYDNAETRHWLGLALADLGFTEGDGRLAFTVEPNPALPGLLRIVADYELRRTAKLVLGSDELSFASGERLRVFVSNRYTPELVQLFCRQHGMLVWESWVSQDGEEGVFVVRLAESSQP
jgi:uncharacterized SAM-dependent methyltransferase